MMGRTFFMEFRKGWKGFLLFMIIILIVVGGMVSFYPTVAETEDPELEGAENVELKVDETGSNITVTWKTLDRADGYRVYADNRTSMITAEMVYNGTENSTVLPHDPEEPLYYSVVGLVDGESKFVGMNTTADKERMLDQLMETGYYNTLSGGRNISMYELKGFLSVEVFSWFFILTGLYIGYISVKTLTNDIEERRIDLIISSGISRRGYLIEKFVSLAVYSLVMLTAAGMVMKLSANGIGENADLSWKTSVSVFLGFWPVLMVVIAVAFLLAVLFKNSRTTVGLILLFGFSQYAMQIISGLSEDYRWVNDFCILGYWDYNSILFDGAFKTGHFFGLLVLSILVFSLAVFTFENVDVPA